jgi:glutamate synthase domain-containing protein 3
MHTEKLTGRTQQRFFTPDEEENFLYPTAFDVDFNKRAEFDAENLAPTEINLKLRELMSQGHGSIVIHNPGAKHGIAVGILNRLNLRIKGSLGYFGCGLVDGPNIVIEGRVGWSCAENMLAGTVVIEKNAGSTFGAAIRGGDLVCKGDVGARMGIDQKGGTIIVGGRAGAFCGFMMQRCGRRRDDRSRLPVARSQAEDVRPVDAQGRQEHDEDRRREAALELRQSGAG